MSLDRTLKTKGALKGSRSVMTRAERITKMLDEEKFDVEKDSPLGIAKTRVIVAKAGGKKKAKKEEEEKAAE